MVFLTGQRGPIPFPANLEPGLAEQGRIVVGKGKFVAVGKRSRLRAEVVVHRDAFGDSDKTRRTEAAQFPEEFTQFFIEEVFKHAAIGDEYRARRRMPFHPGENVVVMKKEALRSGMPDPTFLDLVGVEIDAVKFVHAVQLAGEPFEDTSVARAYLDEADPPSGRLGKFRRDP